MLSAGLPSRRFVGRRTSREVCAGDKSARVENPAVTRIVRVARSGGSNRHERSHGTSTKVGGTVVTLVAVRKSGRFGLTVPYLSSDGEGKRGWICRADSMRRVSGYLGRSPSGCNGGKPLSSGSQSTYRGAPFRERHSCRPGVQLPNPRKQKVNDPPSRTLARWLETG